MTSTRSSGSSASSAASASSGSRGLGCLRSVEGVDIPLRGVSVKAEVLAGHAHARVRQTYKNAETRPIEAVYTFPLPSDATLTAFTMTCDGRTCEGVVKEREEAFAAYDDALTAGHGAALLDQERPNVFTASVGNLLPGEETVIEIAFVQKVQVDEGMIRWTIPTLVAPRYVPGSAVGDRTAHGALEPTDRVPDADRISPPIGDAKYGLELDLVFDVGEGVKVESPSHTVVVTREGSLTRVTFASRTVALDRDVVVTARGLGAEPLVTCLSHKDAGKPDEPGVVALTVIPDLLALGHGSERQEVVFVVDVSGSMGGASIEQARAALMLCTRQLREGDRFNVLAFNDSLTPFQPGLVPFTQATLAQVDAWIGRLQASGGTEMLFPLLEATRQAPGGVIVLLTDGQVGNEEEILSAVLAQRGAARFYAFGIGTNVSDVLLRGLARKTGGAVEAIHPGERIDDKVIAQFARATAVRVTDVTVSFEGLDVGELAPAELPPLVDGEPWTVFGRYERTGRGRAVLRGKLRGEAFALDVPTELGGEPRPALAKLWAKERIKDLEGADMSGRRAAANKSRIVKLAVEHQIASSLTSFVVVEKRTGDRRASGVPETRVLPVHAPAGWAMFEAEKQLSARSRSAGLLSPMLSSPMPRGAPRPSVPQPMPMRPTASGRADMPTGAPPRMAAISPPPASYSAAAPAAGPGGARADDEFVQRAIRPLSLEPDEPRREAQDPVVALLARQLASGLWDDPRAATPESVRLVRATAQALVQLWKQGITTAHPVYGAQVKKAVEALVDKAVAVAAGTPRLAELALAIAWLTAAGPRTRGAIERLVHGNAALGGLSGRLDEAALRADLDRLATA
jgi:Ca-activated chloride channel homolog